MPHRRSFPKCRALPQWVSCHFAAGGGRDQFRNLFKMNAYKCSLPFRKFSKHLWTNETERPIFKHSLAYLATALSIGHLAHRVWALISGPVVDLSCWQAGALHAQIYPSGAPPLDSPVQVGVSMSFEFPHCLENSTLETDLVPLVYRCEVWWFEPKSRPQKPSELFRPEIWSCSNAWRWEAPFWKSFEKLVDVCFGLKLHKEFLFDR